MNSQSERVEFWNEGMYDDLETVIQLLHAHANTDAFNIETDGKLKVEVVNFYYNGTASREQIDAIGRKLGL